MKALIVVDMQNDFVSGIFGNEAAQKIIPGIKKLITIYHNFNDRVIYTQDTHYLEQNNTVETRILPVHCISHTRGWCIVDELAPTPQDIVVKKKNFGYIWDNGIFDTVEDITLVGVCTDICVISNALILRSLYPNTHISVIPHLCAGTTPEAHEAAILVMKNNLIEVEPW